MKKLILYAILLLLFTACSEKTVQEIDTQIVAQSKFTTFNKDIKPLFSIRCAPCHTTGGDRNNKWDDYNTTKTLITGIIGRVIKTPDNSLFMPKNGVKLNDTEMDLLNKWIDNGLLEK